MSTAMGKKARKRETLAVRFNLEEIMVLLEGERRDIAASYGRKDFLHFQLQPRADTSPCNQSWAAAHE